MGKFEKGNRPQPSAYNPQAPSVTRRTSADKAAARPSGSPKKKKKSKLPLILGVVGALCVILACVIGYLYLRDDETIAENVYIAGVNIGGMTVEEAKEALKDVSFDEDMDIRFYTMGADFPTYVTTYDPKTEVVYDIYGNPVEDAQVTAAIPEETAPPAGTDAPLDKDGKPYLLDKTLRLLPEDVGVTLDVEAAVGAAYKVGRGLGSHSNDERVDLDVSDYLTVNETYIREVLESTLEDSASEGTETEVKKTTATVTDEDGNPQTVDALEITLGTLERNIDIDALYQEIVESYMSGSYELQYVYDETIPEPCDLDELYREYGCKAPVNAYIDEDTYEISESENGYGFRMSDAVIAFEKALPGETVTLTLQELEPEYTKEILETKLFTDVLSYYDSPHVYNPVRTHNLELACQAIDGTIVKPGETFSFNKVVGERTAEKGYGEAGVYVGGETVQQLGGGVCQVASTIFYCTIKADLEVVERAEHQYLPSYIYYGMDATVYWGSLDYKWRNNTPYPIRIDASVSDGYVHMRFVGTDTKDYKVELDYVVTGWYPSTEKKIDIYPGMTNFQKYSGYSEGQVIQTAYDGADVTTYRYKYDMSGNLLSTEIVCYSSYDKRDREIAHWVDESTESTSPTESTEPTEPPTESTAAPTTEPTTEPTAEPTTEPTTAPTESSETP